MTLRNTPCEHQWTQSELHFSGLTNLPATLAARIARLGLPTFSHFLSFPWIQGQPGAPHNSCSVPWAPILWSPLVRIFFFERKKQLYRPEMSWRFCLEQSLGFHPVWAVYEDILFKFRSNTLRLVYTTHKFLQEYFKWPELTLRRAWVVQKF